jgi:two-component system, LytTR family, response regulator AlgR
MHTADTAACRVLIVDDEPLARSRLRDLLTDLPGMACVGEAAHGAEALKMTEMRAPDVLLLDIRMPIMDGLEAARHLQSFTNPPAIIFCTAFDDQALAAFDAGAVDYLLKPVRTERLATALRKAQRSRESASRMAPLTLNSRRSQICARVRGELRLVPVSGVDYLLADAKYVEVHFAEGLVLIEESLVSLEQEFGDMFIRIHRNCLVRRGSIAGMSKNAAGEWLLKLHGREQGLEVSRRNAAHVRKIVLSG